jgi:flagellar basal-body rod protein FlgC
MRTARGWKRRRPTWPTPTPPEPPREVPTNGKTVVFQEVLDVAGAGSPPTGSGVSAVAGEPDNAPFPQIFDPSHPDADAKGFVALPNVDPVREMVDLTAATRAYEANVAAFGATKSMLIKAMEIGK